MPTNIEIKARCTDPARQQSLVESRADGPPEVLVQRDTFFRVPIGRLKLREFTAREHDAGRGVAELIFYSRPDAPGPKASAYEIVPIADPAALRAVLAAALGVRGEVRKRRTLYRVGRTRIHFDEVEGLGEFLELEVVLGAGEAPGAGRDTAESLMRRLEIRSGDLVAGAYLDLIEGA